jgi:hypothetical protein
VVAADIHQSDEAALPTARNDKCDSEISAVELFVVLLAGDIPLVLPVHCIFSQSSERSSPAFSSLLNAL